MSNPDETIDDRERRLDEAAAEYFEFQAAGRLPDRQRWLAQYPDLADELAAFLNDLDRFQPAVAPPRADEPDRNKGDMRSRGADDSPALTAATIRPLAGTPGRSTRYQLRQFLARGGMGEVWLGEDLHVGRQIAVKRIRNARDTDPALQERFLFESQIMGQLEHPCIVPLHDIGRDEDGELYSVMKFVRGCSLKQRLDSFHATKTGADWPRQVEFLRMLEAFVNICRAVAYAHSRGVLHRDIKPDNIMLGSYGEALLLDWGLAKVLHPSQAAIASPVRRESVHLTGGTSTMTQAGAILGSPAYMPPEIAAGHSEAADERSDIYLLGATLYEILTGKPPRSGHSRREFIDLAQNAPPPPARQSDSRIPKALEAICLQAMAHDRERRYQSAAAVAGEIERFLAGEPVAAYREPAAVRAWRWCRRHHRAIQKAIIGLSLVALGSLGWSSYRHAQVLENRETARRQLAEFRRLTDEAQYFAASIDRVGEHAPYFDPEHAIQLGNSALDLASHWGDDGSRLPLVEECSSLTSELYDLLLLMANVHQRSAATPESQSQALEFLARAAALCPTSRAYHQIRLRCLRQQGNTVDAEREAARVRATRTRLTAQDWFLEGEWERAEGAWQAGQADGRAGGKPERAALLRAIEAYQRALQIDPTHYWAQFQLARCYLSTQRGPEAVTVLGTCIALRPTVPWAYNTRGLALGLLGRFEDAEADFTQALRLAPAFRPAQLNRGFVYFLQRRDAEALAELDAVLQPPADAVLMEAAFYRAQINYQRGDDTAALRDCGMILAHRPAFALAYALQARIYFRQGDDSKGLQSIAALLSCSHRSAFNPHSPAAKIARGRALRELAINLDLAAQKRVLRLALGEFEAAGGEGTERDVSAVKDLLGLADEAIKHYTERLTAAPQDGVTRKKRGWDYVTLQRYDLAAADFETTIQQSPEDAEAHSGLGYVMALRGELAASQLEAVKAVMYGGHGYLVLHNVACIYAELARANDQQRTPYEDLALKFLERAIMLARQSPGGVDEIELIRAEPAFDEAFRARPEFLRLLGGAPDS